MLRNTCLPLMIRGLCSLCQAATVSRWSGRRSFILMGVAAGQPFGSTSPNLPQCSPNDNGTLKRGLASRGEGVMRRNNEAKVKKANEFLNSRERLIASSPGLSLYT